MKVVNEHPVYMDEKKREESLRKTYVTVQKKIYQNGQNKRRMSVK